jgi:hypothetical protein
MRNTICILVITILTIICVFTPLNNDISEEFGYGMRYCGSCSSNSSLRCASCINCGYCVTKRGYGYCVAGDEQGPYFANDCYDWYYMTPPYMAYHHIYPSMFAYPSSWSRRTYKTYNRSKHTKCKFCGRRNR